MKGYQGSVFCPDRRLCLYPDITPPSDDVNTLPASYTSDPSEVLTTAQDGTWSPLPPLTELGGTTALCCTAAICLLAVLVVVSHRQCRSCSNRVHTVPEHHRQ
ncbi:putative leishmanolysin-like peptidase [Scophthalmus maximus]|uniref:Putative leishmanolysin-like peptidase n=2 Tax=Scophthalmus maximus TaxID=52904 RepID=A0A2U9B117_SCOMX|nr:putative leishmanolysin-like peptidase [Scophthalmus maximus]